MNIVSLLPAVSAYCEERIRELLTSPAYALETNRIDELRRIVILCDGLEKTQNTLTDMLNQKQQPTLTVLEEQAEALRLRKAGLI